MVLVTDIFKIIMSSDSMGNSSIYFQIFCIRHQISINIEKYFLLSVKTMPIISFWVVFQNILILLLSLLLIIYGTPILEF